MVIGFDMAPHACGRASEGHVELVTFGNAFFMKIKYQSVSPRSYLPLG